MLEREISKALIKCIKARKINDYDTEKSCVIIADFFKRANDGMRMNNAFNLTDSELLAEFENALEQAKGK